MCVQRLSIFQYILLRDERDEEIAEIYFSIVEAIHLTPRQIATEFTVQQLLHLWEFKTTETEYKVS